MVLKGLLSFFLFVLQRLSLPKLILRQGHFQVVIYMMVILSLPEVYFAMMAKYLEWSF